MHKKSIVVSSYSFGPRLGSEPGTGWNTVTILAREYQVFVVCAPHYEKSFKKEDFEFLEQQGVQVIFHKDTFDFLLDFKNGVAERLHYWLWQKSARSTFEKIRSATNLILAYHVTWGSGKVVSRLANLGVPFVIGPVGGFEAGYEKLTRKMGLRFYLRQWVRRKGIAFSLKNRKLRKMYQQVDLAIAATEETARAIRMLGAQRIEKMTNAGILAARLENASSAPRGDKPLRILFCGRLTTLKGEELAIRAAASLKDKEWTLTLLGGGPNAKRCQQAGRALGIADQLTFVESVPQAEVWSYYASHDVLIFPSLHDSGGNVVLEAMGHGMPVICLNLGGPPELVDATCGFVVEPASFETVISDLSAALSNLQQDPLLQVRLGENARRKCASQFTWEARGNRLLELIRPLAKS